MIELLVTLPSFADDQATQTVWDWLRTALGNEEGSAFYKHPVVMTATGLTPELTIVTRRYQPIAIVCRHFGINDISAVGSEIWTVEDKELESPLLQLDDFLVILRSKIERDRTLRNRLAPVPVIALPLAARPEFERRFGQLPVEAIWAGGDVSSALQPLDSPLTSQEWLHLRSIIQGVAPLRPGSTAAIAKGTTLGEAIKLLDRQIALLDDEQAKAALQIAPGPQRIRGLAGTGKTVLLAMKAANIHLRFPKSKVLFTFNTQSLYNQTKALISKFYRYTSDTDPDWDVLHIRHAWGGRTRQGVYSDLCGRLGIPPLDLRNARAESTKNSPFQACCAHALKHSIPEEYDFVLVDEAQDFPWEFFRILYNLARPPKQIYWAYDALQSLNAEDIPDAERLFGSEAGKPRVSLIGDPYPGGIEKDFVLHRSYRCTQSVLMLAHALGLGLYNPKGCVQMLASRASWEALGYVIESPAADQPLKEGDEMIVFRPAENSANPIASLYVGSEPVISTRVFRTRKEEYAWLAESIQHDVTEEGVTPEQVVVICLDSMNMKSHLPAVQRELQERGIRSTIPGLIDDASSFNEPGHVTLSTVFRAKGNEAFVVYISTFDALYDYVMGVENRNRAFTAISRSKAWVRISGVGRGMADAETEIKRILNDLPRFRFVFPNMEVIHQLDAETDKRRKRVARAKDSALKLDQQALEALAAADPNALKELSLRIKKATGSADK